MLVLGATGSACPDNGPTTAAVHIEALTDLGALPRPPGHGGRDVGFSAVLDGRSVWIFGDTFLPRPAADGLDWRSSSWSVLPTPAMDDFPGSVEHALDGDQLARQLLPHTPQELDYNQAHQGHDGCSAEEACGSRRTPWPGAIVAGADGQDAVIFYSNMRTGPGGEWDFDRVSGSVATWTDPEHAASRVEPPLFSEDEPGWGAAGLRVAADMYVYACDSDSADKPCLLARVPYAQATERAQYRFWSGQGWSEDWRSAVPVFTGSSLFSVHFNTYLDSYLAWYMAGLGGAIHLRTAPAPEGPWSKASIMGNGLPAWQNWNYALIAHPEWSREGGRVEILSYTHPAAAFDDETRLLEVRFR